MNYSKSHIHINTTSLACIMYYIYLFQIESGKKMTGAALCRSYTSYIVVWGMDWH